MRGQGLFLHGLRSLLAGLTKEKRPGFTPVHVYVFNFDTVIQGGDHDSDVACSGRVDLITGLHFDGRRWLCKGLG